MWLASLAAAAVAVLQFLLHRPSARTRHSIFAGIFGVVLCLVVSKFFTELAKANFPPGSHYCPQPGFLFRRRPQQQCGGAIPGHLVHRAFFTSFARRLLRQSKPVTGRSVVEWLHREKTLLGISSKVGLLSAERISTAVLTGVRKPNIILPASLVEQFTEQQFQNIILHALMHIRHTGYWFNPILGFFETVFFFNPAFLWISGAIRQEQEAGCDHCVTERTQDRKLYLATLVSAYEYSVFSQAGHLSFLEKRWRC